MSTDLILGTLLGFGLSMLMIMVYFWREGVGYNRRLKEYAANMKKSARTHSYWKAKRAHLTIVKDNEDG